ncbi:hypothetical protein D3C86_1306080 [compost metagenome]
MLVFHHQYSEHFTDYQTVLFRVKTKIVHPIGLNGQIFLQLLHGNPRQLMWFVIEWKRELSGPRNVRHVGLEGNKLGILFGHFLYWSAKIEYN